MTEDNVIFKEGGYKIKKLPKSEDTEFVLRDSNTDRFTEIYFDNVKFALNSDRYLLGRIYFEVDGKTSLVVPRGSEGRFPGSVENALKEV